MNVLKRTSINIIKCIKIQTTNSNIIRPIVSYNSDISLRKLYPNSTLKITTPKIPDNTNGFTGYIPIEELNIIYSKSSGPGGQNVNKVNTKVDIRFHLKSVTWLNEEEKEKMAEAYGTRLTRDGYLIFKSDLTRSQQLNLADCLEKIRKAVRSALEVNPEPSPESQELARRRMERAAKERLIIKRQKSLIKNDRRDYNIEV